jgi:DNA ligase-associated metallophosphoesterase
MDRLIQTWPVREIYCLGDLFHSTLNAGWAILADWVQNTGLPFVLIQGNHDRLLPEKYIQAGVTYMPHAVRGPFFLVHDPADSDQAPPHTYTLCGHLHPGVSLAGPGKQTLRLPCFWMGPSVGVLPAFGQFTGLAIQYPQAGDTVFVIADDQVIRL